MGNKKAFLLFFCILSLMANAQLSSNKDKFLGNITTGWGSDMNTSGFDFSKYWNQVTPENATKWSSVEGTRGSFNWGGADKAANYAKQHNFPFKFHTLVWGAQYPDWVNNLSVEERYKAIERWMNAVKSHYPNLQMIDVVNEAIDGHQANTPIIKAALGGDGVTGYDWIIKAFEMAAERWPDAILIYNDFNTFQWNTDQFINLVRTLRDAGAPIDAYGCQSHDLTDCNLSTFKASMKKIQDALKMPMYITEYDIGTSDDSYQKQRFQEQVPVMWEADYCAGITLWGWIYGQTWTTDGNSGLIRNQKERPALTWLREYMQTDAAKNAISPFPGMVKEASVYVRPQSLSVTKGETMSIEVRARLKTKTIDHIDLYVNNSLYQTLSEAPYTVEYVAKTAGQYTLKAIVTATDGSQYERLSGFTAYNSRTPHNGITKLPGILEFEDFDGGGEGLTFHDTDTNDEGGSRYRTNNGGVDIVEGNGGYAIGYTAAGEWMEYTVDVEKAGTYTYEVYASSGLDGSAFSVSLVKNGSTTPLATVNVPKTGDNSWSNYQIIKGTFSTPLTTGQQIIRVTINSPYCNIDKMILKNTSTDTVDPNFYVYLCFGQSNMEGNAQWETVDNQYVDSRFQMLATTNFDTPQRSLGEWYTAYCPIVSPVGKLGMSDYFGRTMVAALPGDTKVGVIAVAMGGSPIEMFDKDLYQKKLAENPDEWWATLSKNYYGGNPYNRLIEMGKKAKQAGVIKGILLHQGCSNCGDPNWPNMVKKIYNDILTDLGLKAADVPLFVGETEREDMGGGCAYHNTVVAKIPDVIPTGHVVSSEGIPGNGSDPWHFSAAGYRIFGKRYAYEVLRTMGIEPKAYPGYQMPENMKNLMTPKNFDTVLTGKNGSVMSLKLMATFADGHREDLTRETTFNSSDFTITNGKIKLGEEGTTGIVTATFTDFLGETHHVNLYITATESPYVKLTGMDQINQQNFFILNEEDGKMFYGSDNQNLGYDAPETVLANSSIVGYMFKAENVGGKYFLRLIKLDGTEYSIWGSPGYLNSQPVDGWCSFILGLNNQNGQDIKDGALWEIQYVNDKGFALKNMGTGLYLKDATPAKYESPTYFNFCIPSDLSHISTIFQPNITDGIVFNIQGLKMTTKEHWAELPRGLYIVNGKKVVKL